MSEKDTTEAKSSTNDADDTAENAALELEAEAESNATAASTAAPAATKKGGGGPVAWLALLLAAAAFAAMGYSIIDDWRTRNDTESGAGGIASSLDKLGERVEASNDSLRDLDRSVTELGDAAARSGAEVDALRREFDNRSELLDSLPLRMSTLESSISSLAGISSGTRDTWLLAEAEYYMQIANAQLQLAGNPHLAALALGMADERIVQLANPALTAVRRAIADEMAALDIMARPDIEGVSLTLASLARVIDSLPLRQANKARRDRAAAPDASLSGVERAWDSVKGAVSGLVRVTPAEQTVLPLIAPEDVYFLRMNLTLQLQSARLALLRGEKAVFEASLDDASAWMRQYFDTRSEPVASALQTISEVRDGMFVAATPDISQSLQLLRQFKTLAESPQ